MRADELMRELENDPEYQARMAMREAEREARRRPYRAAVDPLLRDLESAGIDTTDFGRFVNRVVPGVIEPSTFDAQAATPILIDWLPRMTEPRAKETIVRHLKNKAAKGVAFEVLVAEFRADSSSDNYRWAVGDVLSYVVERDQLPVLAGLAMDGRYGMGRQPLVMELWRVKKPEVERFLKVAIADPTIARVAGTAVRRLLGNDEAQPLLLAQADADDEQVAAAARDHLKRMARARTKRG